MISPPSLSLQAWEHPNSFFALLLSSTTPSSPPSTSSCSLRLLSGCWLDLVGSTWEVMSLPARGYYSLFLMTKLVRTASLSSLAKAKVWSGHNLTRTAWVRIPPSPKHETCLCCFAIVDLRKLSCLKLVNLSNRFPYQYNRILKKTFFVAFCMMNTFPFSLWTNFYLYTFIAFIMDLQHILHGKWFTVTVTCWTFNHYRLKLNDAKKHERYEYHGFDSFKDIGMNSLVFL